MDWESWDSEFDLDIYFLMDAYWNLEPCSSYIWYPFLDLFVMLDGTVEHWPWVLTAITAKMQK